MNKIPHKPVVELRKTLDLAHAALAEAGIEHALIGGLALAEHGVHRATVDVDFLVDGVKADQTKSVLIAKGFKLEWENDDEMMFSGPGYLDILLANRLLSQKMLKQGQPSGSHDVLVVEPEDIIGLKIQAYKNDSSRELQHKADIQAIARENTDLDIQRIRQYAELFSEWDTVKGLLKK